MPSVFHEAIVELFRQRPMLAAQLLGNTLSVPLPSFTQARIESAAFADLTPPEYRADLVVVLGDQSPVLGVVVEVQLGVDAKKRLSWPHYATSLRARLGCPTCVLVYAPNERVARWAGATVPGGPGWTFAPIVIGPDLVPVIDVVNSGMPHPELAVLSVVAHGNRLPARRAALVATAAVRATEKLRDELRMLYYDLILGALSDAARKEFEAMDLKNYAYKSAFARKYVAKGKAEGRAEGEARGRLEGEAHAILRVLEARGVVVGAAVRRRILSCGDQGRLDQWLKRATVAATAADVVGKVGPTRGAR